MIVFKQKVKYRRCYGDLKGSLRYEVGMCFLGKDLGNLYNRNQIQVYIINLMEGRFQNFRINLKFFMLKSDRRIL